MKFVGFLVIATLLVVASPFIYYTGIGIYKGFDVASAYRHLFSEPPKGATINEDELKVSRKRVTWSGDLQNHLLSEASGMAQSGRDENVFYALNDSGNDPVLFAFDEQGEDIGFWSIDVEENVDWEDLSAFRLNGEDYLLIADTGDNFRWRPQVSLIVIKEPDVQALGMDEVIPVAWQFNARYPEGYRDSEAVAVDENSETVFLLSKRRVPSEVFRVPLQPGTDTVTAVRMALLTTLPQPNERDLMEDSRFGESRSQPTAFDIKGRLALVVTYKDAYLYRRGLIENWIDAFAKPPERIPLPLVSQQEAGALSRDRDNFYVTTERANGTNRAGIYQVEL